MAHIAIPEEIPVMTLPEAVLFPQAMMPLHIFEPRYQQMLAEVLESHRLFAVAGLSDEEAGAMGMGEPACPVATVGIVRACHKNDDNTANLILQGLARVRFEEIVREEPFRIARVRALPTQNDTGLHDVKQLRTGLLRLIKTYHKLGAPNAPSEILDFLSNLRDAETLVDLSAFTLCPNADIKQELLEILPLTERFNTLMQYLKAENERLQIEHKLKGGLDTDDFSLN